MKQQLFCFGLGYTAQNLVRHLKQQDASWKFSGTCTTPSDENVILFDGISPMTNLKNRLADVTHMLISIPPQNNIGDPVLHHHIADFSQLENLKWLGYLSTTSIYGDHRGNWVDDETPPAPHSLQGQQRLEAEQAWLKILQKENVPVHIFRLGSIYGPDRGLLANLQAGRQKKVIKRGQYFSRIHVDDLAQVLMASIKSPDPGRSYNVVDDLPTATPDILDYICNLLGRPHLPAIDINDAKISPILRIFYSENKRVRNDRIKQELGVSLKYPTYKEGFSSLVRSLR